MATAKKSKAKPVKKARAAIKQAATVVEQAVAAVKRAAVSAKRSPAKAQARPQPKVTPAPARAAKASATPAGIGPGSRAPTFKLKDQSGKEVTSASLAGAPYVLYFYPKDDTTGCTKEACGFRDSFRHFGKKKARILGVSPDSEASHTRFVEKYGLPFTLLSDPDKVLANAYGVWVKKLNYGREYMGIARSTFVVDAKGVVQKAWRGVRVDGHVDAVLAAL